MTIQSRNHRFCVIFNNFIRLFPSQFTSPTRARPIQIFRMLNNPRDVPSVIFFLLSEKEVVMNPPAERELACSNYEQTLCVSRFVPKGKY
jgi:hypothetical protein